MAYPQTPLDVLIELYMSGAWQDITDDVYVRDGIQIQRGRHDEGQRVDPGKCTLTLNNGASRVAPGVSGRYSPRNPRSDLYGLIGRNTPLRVSVAAGSSYLTVNGTTSSTQGASTPDAAVLDITGDLDVRIDATLDNWADGQMELCGKGAQVSNQRSWMLEMKAGKPFFEWSSAGTSTVQVQATQAPVIPPNGRLAVRVTLDVDNGAGGNTTTFYTAPSIAGPWTPLGTPIVTSGATSIFASTAPVIAGQGWADVAFDSASGRIHAFELRSGINGTVVTNPDFRLQTPGATSFVDGCGLTWTVRTGSSISQRRTRFVGEVSSWPARWDVSGKDVYVPVEAAGVLRRYGQGAKALDSTLRRRIPSGAPIAYWPLEEPRGATQLYSPIDGVRPLKTSGLDLASADSLAGSSALPTVQAGATLSGVIPAPGGTPSSWHTEFVFFLPNNGPATARTILEWTGSGTVRRWRLMLKANEADIYGYDADGTQITASLLDMTGRGIFNAWCRWQLYAVQNGSNIDWTALFVPIGGTGAFTTTTVAGTVGRITGVSGPSDGYSGDLDGLALGHIGVFTTAGTTIYNNADLGFAGETAGTRLARLSTEESKPIAVFGDSSQQEQVGAQKPQTFLDLIEDAAAVDGGILYEQRDTLGLAYRDRASLYNQPVALALDYTASGHVAPPLEPVDDDQAVRNDVTVSREGGSAARAVLEDGALSTQAPPDGVGVYDESVTLNLYSDDQAEPHAYWRLHLGTVDEARYPVVNLDLAAAPSLIDQVTALESGDRLQIANPPNWLPPGTIDLLMQGYSEAIGHPVDWTVQLTCTPASPWTVGVVADDTDPSVAGTAPCRVDTDGSQLAAAVAAGDTTVSVLTTAGPLWTTNVRDTPFDLRIGGEVMTVTAPGTLLNGNAFFNTDVTGWSGASASVTYSTTVVAPDPHAVGSMLVMPAGGVSAVSARSDLTAVGSVTAGQQYKISAWFYSPGGWSTLSPNVQWADAAGSVVGSAFTPRSVPAGQWTYLEDLVTAPAGASRARIAARSDGTPTASDIYYVWAVRITAPPPAGANPRTFSVIRSVNGIIKAQSAGTDVRLATPAIVAL